MSEDKKTEPELQNIGIDLGQWREVIDISEADIADITDGDVKKVAQEIQDRVYAVWGSTPSGEPIEPDFRDIERRILEMYATRDAQVAFDLGVDFPILEDINNGERQRGLGDEAVSAVTEGVKLGTHCKTCHKLLNDPRDPSSLDCGGDCWACVGEAEGRTINTHPIIKRGGIFSKARMCFWCRGDMRKQRRWTGWWAKPKGWKRFRPCCSHHAGVIQFGEGGTVQLRTT